VRTHQLGRVVEHVTTPPHGKPLQFVSLDQVETGMGRLLEGLELEEHLPGDAGMLEVRADDVLFGKLRPYLAKSLLADRDILASSEFIVMRARPSVHPRWLAYIVQSRPFIEWAVATSEGVKMPRTSWEKLRLFEISTLEPNHQLAIIGFLDGETQRIDGLIAKKRRLIELAREKVWASFIERVMSSTSAKTPLRRALHSIRDGPFGSAFSADEYSEDGAFVVRLGNIGFAEFRHEDGAFIPIEMYQAFLRHRVDPGDLLIAGLGDDKNHAGRACIAPDLGPAMVKGKCFCARVNAALADPAYLSWYLSSSLGAQEINIAARGSTRSMINLEIAKAVMVRLPSVQCQREIVRRSEKERESAKALVGALEKQVSLLLERRQALITAAVSGHLGIHRATT
jgi:type I restriction enzyme S subunit